MPKIKWSEIAGFKLPDGKVYCIACVSFNDRKLENILRTKVLEEKEESAFCDGCGICTW